MKAAWKRRKAAKTAEAAPVEWNVQNPGKNADELTLGFTNGGEVEAKKIAQGFEAELHRRDKELIAEWKRAIADTRPKQIYGGAVIVPWSTVDAILNLLPTE